MTIEELAAQNASEIRRNENLMRLYMKYYKDVFFSVPNCASCSFKRDFKKFQKAVLGGNVMKNVKPYKTIEMARNENDFELKRQHQYDILAYRKDGRPYRSYGNKLTSKFVSEFLENGTERQLEERRKMFKRLPGEKPNETEKTQSVNSVSNEGGKEPQQDTENNWAVNLLSLKLSDLEKKVKGISDPEVLRKLKEEEQREDPRKGAIEMIEERLEEIQEQQRDEEQ